MRKLLYCMMSCAMALSASFAEDAVLVEADTETGRIYVPSALEKRLSGLSANIVVESVAVVQSNLAALAETVGGITAESLGALTEESDPAWTAASGSVVYATTPGYTAAVEQAATAFGWGDHAEAGYLTAEADAAALSAVAAVSGRVDVVESWGDHAEAGYLTAEADAAALSAVAGVQSNLTAHADNTDNPHGVTAGQLGALTEESDPAWTAASGSVVYATTPGYTAAVEQAATAYGWGDHAEAGYLPLSGYDGLVVLGTRTRGYAASTNMGDYGFAAGRDTSAGDYGFAAGASSSAGDYGFAAGRAAKGANGSFVFADSAGMLFSRTNFPNSFSLRVAGGIYAEIGTNVFAVSNAVTMNGVELGAGGGTGISAAEAGQIATNVLSTATTNSMPLIDFGSGGGWTNLSFSGTGNAITNATAAGTTLTLQRGTIEGGGSANTGAEGEPLTYTWSTNIALVAGTNQYNQRLLSIDGPTTITPPTKASVSNDYLIKLIGPSAGTNSVLFATNSPPVVGYVPSVSTSSYWVVLIGSDAGSSNVWMRRQR